MDLIVVYMWFVGILICLWVFFSLALNLFFSPFVGCVSLGRLKFDYFEFVLVVLFSVIILLLIFFNLLIMRSHNPSRGFYFSSYSGSISVVGRQWYWEYSHLVNGVISGLDSYYSCFVDCVDNGLNLGYKGVYCLNITSGDVLHSFSLPAANMKIDAIPGRINNVFLYTNVLGRHVGYCSEFCGAGHGYMPIVVNVL
uniref:cytochrome-c oxidase n=1 Tax=Sindiplozoon sp. DZ-2018 TaxID=2340795 RepID=A0A386PZM3_9PLAT|nr:cytochrome c oxidase subunit 2 [Sindiplozoon sp. DZ-2018]